MQSLIISPCSILWIQVEHIYERAHIKLKTKMMPITYPTPIANPPINKIYNTDFTLPIPIITDLARPKLIKSRTEMARTKGHMLVEMDGSIYPTMYGEAVMKPKSYKYVTSSLIEGIGQFQAQIQEGMQRYPFIKKIIGIVKGWELRIKELKQFLNEDVTHKQKLIFKEAVSVLTYYCSEHDGKLENLGLLIQAHKKCTKSYFRLHKARQTRIIGRKSFKELPETWRRKKEVRNRNKFIERQESYNKFIMWSEKLETLIFQN